MSFTTSKPIRSSRSHSCEICDDIKGKCKHYPDSGIWLCMSFADACSAPPGFKYIGTTTNHTWGKFAPDLGNLSSEQWDTLKREREALKQQRAADEAKKRAESMPAVERDRLYQQLLNQLSLSPADRADLHRRGISDEQIKAVGFKSVEQWQKLETELPHNLPGVQLDGRSLNTPYSGYLCPIRDTDGLIVGCQVRNRRPQEDDPKYCWLTSNTKKRPNGASPNLPNGELPLAIFEPGQIEQRAIALVEGTGAKPLLLSQRLNLATIGAAGGQFASSPQTLEGTLRQLSEGLETTRIEFYPDAGACQNQQVLRQYRAAWKLLQSLGYSVKIAWWSQTTKGIHADIDELEDLDSIRFITIAEFEAIAETFLPVTTLSQPQKLTYEEEVERVQKKLRSLTYTPTTELNQRFLGELPLPAPGTIEAISAACKTGKTESMNGFVDDQGVKRFEGIIAKHRTAHPDAKIFVIGYRNTLLKQTAKRLGITHIQDLRGKGYRAIQATREIAFCLDSLDKIDLDSIPPNSLIILDEGDATLKHGLEGGTLKGRQAEILSLFQKMLNKVLGDGGAVLLMEDNVTDLPIDTLKALTGNRYPVDLTVNLFKPSHWDVSIGDGSKAGLTKRIVECLRDGKRLMVVTSAQKKGEEFDLIIQQEFDGTKKIVRLDSKTVELLHSLVDDPNAWLKDAGIDLLICSPTAESGFNITIDVFDRVIGYFVSGETRTHIQLLERYRLDVPREIFCSKFCNFGDGTGRSPLPANILKDWKLLTKQSAMVNQIEPSLQADANANPDLSKRLERFKNPSEQQEVWNQAAANYRARINGSNSAMLERLTEALTDRGHDIASTKWQKDEKFKQLHKEARREIDRGEATKLSGADAHGVALDDARSTLNSGTASQDDLLVARKRVLQDELPGAPLADVDFVLKALIENSGRFKRQTEFLHLCQNSDIASFLDKRAFESQLDKPFVMLRRFRHNRVKVDLMTGIFDTLMRIAHSESYRESDKLLQAVKEWAVRNAFEIWRVYGLKVTEEQTAITIANKLLKKLGFKTEVEKQEGSGRNGNQRSRIWRVVDANCHHRAEILKALRIKWEREFSKAANTILNTELPLNKIVFAPPETPPKPQEWDSEDSLKEIRNQWNAAQSDEERDLWRRIIPIEVLELAIS